MKRNTDLGSTNLLSVHAPTPTLKGAFFSQLYDVDVIKHIPKKEVLILLGDFNARVGNYQGPTASVILALANATKMVNVCWGLALISPLHYKHILWRQIASSRGCTRSKNWYQLDHVISRQEHLNNIRITRAYHIADCDTDHSLVCMKVQLRPQKFHINTAATVIPENEPLFKDILSSKRGNCQELYTDVLWCHIRETIHAAVLKAFGKKEPKNQN